MPLCSCEAKTTWLLGPSHEKTCPCWVASSKDPTVSACYELSPESGTRCWLPQNHRYAHEGPHPKDQDGWTITWPNYEKMFSADD